MASMTSASAATTPGAMAIYHRRRRGNGILLILSFAATIFGLAWLLLILGALIYQGLSGLTLDVFTQMTPPAGAQGGGLLNAIVGSLIMTFGGVIVGTPIGILAGTYMSEYGRYNRFSTVVRFINDILLAAPSIIIGLFVYEIMVVPTKHFSAIAGMVALAILVIPVVVRTTEDMLSLVPNQLREAAAALGLPRAVMIRHIAYRAALSGIVTGVLLAIARVSGETAPLLFTAFGNTFWSTNINAPMSSLPGTIFQFAGSADDNWQRLAWSGALLITVTVLALNIIARAFLSPRTKK